MTAGEHNWSCASVGSTSAEAPLLPPKLESCGAAGLDRMEP